MAPSNSSHPRNEFKPTDGELLQLFLYNKIHGKPFPNHATILEHDLFGGEKNPWEIWEEFGGSYSYGGKDLYFFTTLKKKSPTSSRLVRTIGLGSWEGEDTGKIIIANDTNQLLGKKKRFRFDKSGTDQDGGWILHEYSLDPSLLSDPSAINNVLCRVRKNSRNTTGQARRRRTVLLGPAATANSDNNVRLGEDIYRGSRDQPNGGDNRTEVVETTTRTESEHKEEEDGAKNTRQEKTRVTNQRRTIRQEETRVPIQGRTIVLGLAAATGSREKDRKTNMVGPTNFIVDQDNNKVWLGKDIYQGPNQADSGDKKAKVVETTTRREPENNEEEDGDLTMSWQECFPLELRGIEECLMKDEDIPMLPNEFYKELLLENIDIKYISSCK